MYIYIYIYIYVYIYKYIYMAVMGVCLIRCRSLYSRARYRLFTWAGYVM